MEELRKEIRRKNKYISEILDPIPPSTAIVSNNLKSLFDRCSTIMDKSVHDILGFNVLVNDVFPFEDLDGNVFNGVIKDASGKLIYIKQVK
jgi:hypothetical protein